MFLVDLWDSFTSSESNYILPKRFVPKNGTKALDCAHYNVFLLFFYTQNGTPSYITVYIGNSY